MNELQNRKNANLGFGVMLVVLGLLFLIGQFAGGRFWDGAWPFVIIIPGLMFFVGMMVGGKPAGGSGDPRQHHHHDWVIDALSEHLYPL